MAVTNKSYDGTFLKWAGGKKQLLNEIFKRLPEKLLTQDGFNYIEPFVGGGAVFFALKQNFKINKAILLDANPDLTITYHVVKNNVDNLIDKLKEHEEKYLASKERADYFYHIRENFNNDDVIDSSTGAEIAARFIFLNRTCFNGLYRVNQKGNFNVPHGKYKNPTICNEKRLRHSSELLKNTIILCGDFAETEKYITENVFIYYDPPYRPISATASFNSYSKEAFNDDEQVRLSDFIKSQNKKKNIFQMLSNSDPKNIDPGDNFFENKYSGFNIDKVNASRMINSNASKRGKIKELIITNY